MLRLKSPWINEKKRENLCSLESFFFASVGTVYSPEFGDDTDSVLEGPTGLTCWWNKSSRVQGGKKKQKHKATGAMRRKTRTSWNPVCYVSWGHSGPLEWKLQRQKTETVSVCELGSWLLHCVNVKHAVTHSVGLDWGSSPHILVVHGHSVHYFVLIGCP